MAGTMPWLANPLVQTNRYMDLPEIALESIFIVL